LHCARRVNKIEPMTEQNLRLAALAPGGRLTAQGTALGVGVT
jgi:hypothetical protein